MKTTVKPNESRTFWYLSAGASLVFSLGCLGGGGGDTNNDPNNDTSNNPLNNTTANNSDGCPDLDPAEFQSGDVTLEEGCYDALTGLFKLDGTLTLEPGVTINFGMGTQFSASGGKINAVGTADKPIKLTSRETTPGAWLGVTLANSRSADNVFDHVEISYAGGANSAGALVIDGNTLVDIKNSTISNNAGIGLVVREAVTDITVAATTFLENDQSIAIHADNIEGLSSDLTLESNMAGHVEILGTSLEEDQTWPTLAEPYFFPVADRGLRVAGVLTLSPGTTIIFAQNSGLEVDGGDSGLNVAGTMEEPITLTGVEQLRGQWRGVHYSNSKNSANALDWVKIEYAGSGQWDGNSTSAGGLFVEDSRLSVSNCTFEQNDVAGLHFVGAGNEVSVSSSSFVSNLIPIIISSTLVGDLQAGLTFEGNDSQEIFIYGRTGRGGASVVEDQTWLAFDVPYRAFESDILVESSLTLSPGVVVTFEQDIGLFIVGASSALIADASEGEPIILQAAMGETNPGAWKGVALENSKSPENKMINTQILYGGGVQWDGGSDSAANLLFRVNSSMALEDVTLTDSGSGIGLSMRGDTNLTSCSNLTNPDGYVLDGSDMSAPGSENSCPPQ